MLARARADSLAGLGPTPTISQSIAIYLPISTLGTSAEEFTLLEGPYFADKPALTRTGPEVGFRGCPFVALSASAREAEEGCSLDTLMLPPLDFFTAAWTRPWCRSGAVARFLFRFRLPSPCVAGVALVELRVCCSFFQFEERLFTSISCYHGDQKQVSALLRCCAGAACERSTEYTNRSCSSQKLYSLHSPRTRPDIQPKPPSTLSLAGREIT